MSRRALTNANDILQHLSGSGNQLALKDITWGDTLLFWGEHKRKTQHNSFVREMRRLDVTRQQELIKALGTYLEERRQYQANRGAELNLQQSSVELKRDYIKLTISKEKTARGFLLALTLISLTVILPSMYSIVQNRAVSQKFGDNLISVSLVFFTLSLLHITIARSSYFNGKECYQIPINNENLNRITSSNSTSPTITELPDNDSELALTYQL